MRKGAALIAQKRLNNFNFAQINQDIGHCFGNDFALGNHDAVGGRGRRRQGRRDQIGIIEAFADFQQRNRYLQRILGQKAQQDGRRIDK